MKFCIQLLFFLLICAGAFAQTPSVLPVNEFEKAIQPVTTQLIDVRTPSEFKEGFIPGAVNIDWLNEKQFSAQAKKLNKDAPVYLYCLSGIRSGKAADWLTSNGFKKVVNLDGGIKAWKDAGKKIVTK